MMILRDDLRLNGVPIVRMESDTLRVDVAPSVGGRIVSLIEKPGGYEFLWRNRSLPLERMPAGTEYDPHFFGGVDELLPNDLPEQISEATCPDHGELWTLPLSWSADGSRLTLDGTLPRCGLHYHREMTLRPDAPCLDLTYRISNPTGQTRRFLWKLHAALAINPGDIIDCPARQAQVVDLNYSRFTSLAPFAWPTIDGQAANVIPPGNGTIDFFYLFDLSEGRMAWRRLREGLEFAYHFDTQVFPYAWMFASYGGFLGHYTVVLEPCTAMPISVNQAAAQGQCSVLQPGHSLETRVAIQAGHSSSLSLNS